MQSFLIGKTGPASSRLGYGCMRLAGDGTGDALARGKRAIHVAVEAGYTLFDHADIYAAGACETLFGEVLKESAGLRDAVQVMGKCGIRVAGDPSPHAPKRYDFSAEHIERSVEGSLRRLCTDRLDFLLLHRPDYLMDAAEVAAAFERLQHAGKVLHFGVSNFTPSQFDLLQSACSRRLLVNQVEINLHAIGALTDGTLDQCQRLGITPQAWCPLGGVAYPAWGSTWSAETAARLRAELTRQAADYGVEDWQVALAWLLKHPAGISPVMGSATPERIVAATRALEIDYRREDWYRLLEARTGKPVA